MKRHTFIYLAALLTMLGTVLPLSAQQTQDALYIYRNDGKFNGFFYADIDRFEYSKVDTLGVEHDEFVVQEVYALDSVFRIPLNAIDSIAFVTPETQYQPGVTTAESTLWNYVISSDSMTTFTLSASTPQSLVPKVGDKLANPTATPFLPGGFFGQVASVTKSGAGTVVKCSQVDPSELFKRFIGKFAGRAETEEAAARRRADANPPNYNATETYIPLPPIKVDVDLNKGWALGGFGIKLNDNFSVTGEGNFTFSLEPTLLVRSFFEVSQEDGTFFDMTTRLQMTTDLSLEAKVEATASLDLKAFETKFPLGSTGLWAVYENGSTFGLTGSLSAFMKWHNVTSAYGMLQWIKGYKEEGAGTINVLTNDFNWGLSGSVGMNMGIYHQVKVEAVHKLIAEAALRFETGLKAELGSDLSFTDLLTLGSPVLMSLLDSRSYYQKLNRDLALKFGLYGNGKLSITLVGGMVTKDFTIYDKEAMNVDWPQFSLVPNFKSLKWEVDEKRPWRGIVTASLDRKLAYPLSVGQALFEKSKNEFYSHAFEDNKYSSPNDFKSYTYGYEYLQPSKTYRVYPTVGFNIPFYQTLMADKYVDFTLGPPAITFEPGPKLEVSPFAGSKQVVVKTNMYNTEMEDPKNASWLRTSYLKDDADLKVYFDELPDNIDSRRAAIHFIGRDSLNTNVLKEDSIVVTQLRASIKADPGTLEFDAKGGEKTVKLTTTVEDLSVQFGYNKDNFCKYTFDAKKNTITVTVPENKAKDERSASIIVSGVSPGGQKAECRIDVFQDGTGGDDPGPGPGPNPSVVETTDTIYFDGYGGNVDIVFHLDKSISKYTRFATARLYWYDKNGNIIYVPIEAAEPSGHSQFASITLKDKSDPMNPIFTFTMPSSFYPDIYVMTLCEVSGGAGLYEISPLGRFVVKQRGYRGTFKITSSYTDKELENTTLTFEGNRAIIREVTKTEMKPFNSNGVLQYHIDGYDEYKKYSSYNFKEIILDMDNDGYYLSSVHGVYSRFRYQLEEKKNYQHPDYYKEVLDLTEWTYTPESTKKRCTGQIQKGSISIVIEKGEIKYINKIIDWKDTQSSEYTNSYSDLISYGIMGIE